MTPAQTYSLVFGATLLLGGLLGFVVNAEFNTGAGVQGDDLVFFEVNGFHNLVHITSGLLGLALFRRNKTARLFALGFGAVYLLVTIYGLIDGNDFIGLLPINGADNVLHLLISGAGIAAGLASPEYRRTSTNLA